MTDAEKIEMADMVTKSIEGNLKLLQRLKPEDVADMLLEKNLKYLHDQQEARHNAWANVLNQMAVNMVDVEKRIAGFKAQMDDCRAFVNRLNASFGPTIEDTLKKLERISTLADKLSEESKAGALGTIVGMLVDRPNDDPALHALALENILIRVGARVNNPEIEKEIIDVLEKHGTNRI